MRHSASTASGGDPISPASLEALSLAVQNAIDPKKEAVQWLKASAGLFGWISGVLMVLFDIH